MKRTIAAMAFAVLLTALPGSSLYGQSNDRKVITRVTPIYSDLARNLNAKGTVKLEVVVAPNGSVREINVKGGHPLLVVSAQDAVKKWKWEAAPHETKENVEVKFGANE